MGWREGGGDEWKEMGRLVGEEGNEGCEFCCRQNNGGLKLPSLKARGLPLLLQRVHGIARKMACGWQSTLRLQTTFLRGPESLQFQSGKRYLTPIGLSTEAKAAYVR